jgi:molybdopterin molybdotransferase
MLSVDEVVKLVGEKVEPLPPCKVRLLEGHGSALAEDVRMGEPSPPFDRAQLDGFAVRSADFHREGLLDAFSRGLRLIGQMDAGTRGFPSALQAGECVGINTGAMMPEGADAVLMVEYSERVADADGTRVKATRGVTPGYGVQRKGSDAEAGEIVLASGRRLFASEMAVAATAGAATVSVRRLRASLLTTGDELVPVDVQPAPGQIRNSNHAMLASLLSEFGAASVLDLGTCGDDAGRLRGLLKKGLEESALLLVSGGMSMGTKDLVPRLLKELGVTFYVEKVRMKPGKPLVIGRWGESGGGRRCYVAGLPGNPVSGFVCFHRFVREMMARLLRADEGSGVAPEVVEAHSSRALGENGDREFYLPCQLSVQEGVLRAEPLAWKGSADLFTISRANGLMIRPAGAAAAEAGSLVRVLGLAARFCGRAPG